MSKTSLYKSGETAEQVQERVNLTPSQKKAWSQLVRAVGKCKAENIYFYLVLDSLSGLNGHEVRDVENREYTDLDYGSTREIGSVIDTHGTISLACSFADDTHVIKFHDD